MRSWDLTHQARPPTMNAYRRLHHYDRAAVDLEWRQTFAWLARAARVPRLDAALVTVAQTCRRPPLPDVGACFPIAKAAIDGLVDARVIPDDDPAHLLALTFVAPTRSDLDRFLLIVQEADPEGPRPA